MIDYKAVQLALNSAGASPPLVLDGNWGPKSVAALTAYQKGHGLVVDGKLGPKSLAALGLAAVGAPPGGAATAAGDVPRVKGNANDAAAYAVSKRALPTMPEAQRQYVLTVARGEGGYGNGWGNVPKDGAAVALLKAKGLTGKEGVGSNNWGAEQGKGDAGSFPHVDFGWRNPDGTAWNGKGPKVWLPYIGQYKRHSTPEKGFLSVAATILNGGKRGTAGAKEIQAAIAKGDLRAAVMAQHANGYFELDPEQYLTAVTRNYAALTDGTGWKPLLAGAAAGLGVLFFALTTAGTVAAWWMWKKARGG